MSSLLLLAFAIQASSLFAQNEITIIKVSFRNTITTFKAIDPLTLQIKNTGASVYNGIVYIDFKTYSMSKRSLLDSINVTNLKPNDTATIYKQDYSVESTYFNLGKNIFVVWPRGAGINKPDSAITSVWVVEPSGIAESKNNEKSILLYPNPAYSRLYILPTDSKNSIESVRIYTSSGSLIGAVKSTNNLIDISNLSQGLYFIEIETKLDKRIVKQFIKD